MKRNRDKVNLFVVVTPQKTNMEPKNSWVSKFPTMFFPFQGACFRFYVSFGGEEPAPLEEGRGSVHSDHFACRPPVPSKKHPFWRCLKKTLFFSTTSSFFVNKAMPVENHGFKTSRILAWIACKVMGHELDTILYLDLPGRVCFKPSLEDTFFHPLIERYW